MRFPMQELMLRKVYGTQHWKCTTTGNQLRHWCVGHSPHQAVEKCLQSIRAQIMDRIVKAHGPRPEPVVQLPVIDFTPPPTEALNK